MKQLDDTNFKELAIQSYEYYANEYIMLMAE